jgi:hypothetical protein
MAGTLTVNLALQKSRVDNPMYVRKLNVCGVQLDDINVVQQFGNLEVCSFSVNKISDLEAFRNCSRLTELYLRKNNISDLRQVLHLSHLPSLSMLGMSENPISESPDYRAFVIAACPHLVKLDDAEISPSERDSAEAKFGDCQNLVAPTKSSYLSPRGAGRTTSNSVAAPPPPAAAQQHHEAPHFRAAGGAHDDVPVGGGRVARPGGARIARSPPQNQPPAQRAAAVPTSSTPRFEQHESAHMLMQHHQAQQQQPQMRAVKRESPPTSNVGIREEAVLKAIYALLPELSPAGLHAVRAHVAQLEGR